MQTEVHIYGSSRLGIEQRNITYSTSPFAWLESEQHRDAGTKRYELTDHLGNVRVTISDLLVPRPASSFGYVTQDAEVIDRRDYYPFGMEMPGRRWRATGEDAARFGFNGKENDNEVKGEGNQQDYGFRIYDPRVARFLSVDPLTKDYPSWSPYPFAMNRVIDGIDLDGKEWSSVKTIGENGKVQSIVYTVRIKVVNSSALTGALAESSVSAVARGIEQKFSGTTDKGVKVQTHVVLESVSQLGPDDYGISIVDAIPNKDPSSSGAIIGIVDAIGNSQTNRIRIVANQSLSEFILTGVHEAGHTVGLRHENDAGNPPELREVVTRKNVMHSSAPGTTEIHPKQLRAIDSEIPNKAVIPASTPMQRDATSVVKNVPTTPGEEKP